MLVISKPAGIPTMGAVPGEPSLHQWACDYLKVKYGKPGNVFLGVVSRLDSFVSGVIVLARTSKSAGRLSEQFRTRQVAKEYLAVVSGSPRQAAPSSGNLYRVSSHLRKNDRLRRVEVFSSPVPGSQHAELEYRILRSGPRYSLLAVNLLTGRKHQIRAQLSELGCPIYGDRKYGATESLGNRIALHAQSLTLTHPTLKQTLTFHAPVPRSWHEIPSISPLLDGL